MRLQSRRLITHQTKAIMTGEPHVIMVISASLVDVHTVACLHGHRGHTLIESKHLHVADQDPAHQYVDEAPAERDDTDHLRDERAHEGEHTARSDVATNTEVVVTMSVASQMDLQHSVLRTHPGATYRQVLTADRTTLTTDRVVEKLVVNNQD